MTNNQINWMRMMEERRTNRAKEALTTSEQEETRRHNVNVELENMRHNTAQEVENYRHNYAAEQANLFKFGEEQRHNVAQESIGRGNIELGYGTLSRNWAETEVAQRLASVKELEAGIKQQEVTDKGELIGAQIYRMDVQNYNDFADDLGPVAKKAANAAGLGGLVLRKYVNAWEEDAQNKQSEKQKAAELYPGHLKGHTSGKFQAVTPSDLVYLGN